MLMKARYFFSLVAILGIVGWGPFSFLFEDPQNVSETNEEWLENEIRILNPQASNLSSSVLRLSLIAYLKARQQGLDDKKLLTIIDYSKPSNQRRLWVADLKRHRILFNTWVSHGKNSGKLNATSFSNKPGSLKSSLGLFLTENSYDGGNGYSLRLIGLEHGINDNAYRRDIVMHGAWYAQPEVIRRYGLLGRSWGCPTVSAYLARPLIDTIKNRTLVFVYSNDHHWLKRSTYLT